MNRLWARAREIVWLAVLAVAFLVAAVVMTLLGMPDVGIAYALVGIGFALLARGT